MKRAKKKSFICYCNSIEKQTVVDAINGGCKNIHQIFNKTTAGCGPCGGTCQPDIRKLLKDMLAAKSEDEERNK